MKAYVQDRYGPAGEVLQLREVDRPVPGEGEILVRVEAVSVNPADWHMLRGLPRIARLSFGARGPKDPIPGCDLAGTVEAVGEGVTDFAPGDEVYGSPFANGFGAFAELAAVPAEIFAAKPGSISFEEAAAVPVSAVTALQGLRDHGGVEKGQRVMIVGASGGVGTFAVQLAKQLGAEVTGVCSGRNVELVRSLGADHVIDYTQQDPARAGGSYDLILQLAGTAPPSDLRRALTDEGKLLLSSGESSGKWFGPLARVMKARAMSPFVSQRLESFTFTPNRADLQLLGGRIEAGELRPVIDRTYPFEGLTDAIAYVETVRARGKVVVTVAGA